MEGIIDISKLKNPPEKHELETAKYFAARGFDIEFIPPSNIPEVHSADLIMCGVRWEVKSPTGKSKRTIENNFKKAVTQARFIIFDLRRIKVAERQCLSQLEEKFNSRKYIKRLLVIKKNGELVEFSRRK